MRPLPLLAALLVLAACGSAPPAEPDPPEASGDIVTEEEIIEELEPGLGDTPGIPQAPPPEPEEPEQEVVSITDIVQTRDSDASPQDTPPPAAPEVPMEGAAELAVDGTACSAPLPASASDWAPAGLPALAARVGCGYDGATADLGLDDPIETLTSLDGSMTVETFARPGTAPEALQQHVLAQNIGGRLASIAYLWRARPEAAMALAREVATGAYGEPDMDLGSQVMWFDDAELPVGVIVQETELGVQLQIIHPRIR